MNRTLYVLSINLELHFSDHPSGEAIFRTFSDSSIKFQVVTSASMALESQPNLLARTDLLG